MSQEQGTAYRPPNLLRDVLLIDMLELTGSTAAAARVLSLSQPTVSRRYRALARDLGLVRQPHLRPGRRFGESSCLQLLRKGLSLHRWQAGVLRIGGRPEHRQQVAGQGWLHWVGLEALPLEAAAELIHQDVLDGLIVTERETAQLRCLCRPVIRVGDDLVLVCRRHPRIQRLMAGLERQERSLRDRLPAQP
ncbi:LysR family transcriptional regulator [Vulcanococcus limneticus]|uniref:helix-turn-helix domain-containing protein n=1 Tax=Vulcanococcus limneticus TaxID=2170428 RepID=UPI00398C1DAC